jgi:hypothetical protein
MDSPGALDGVSPVHKALTGRASLRSLCSFARPLTRPTGLFLLPRKFLFERRAADGWSSFENRDHLSDTALQSRPGSGENLVDRSALQPVVDLHGAQIATTAITLDTEQPSVGSTG